MAFNRAPMGSKEFVFFIAISLSVGAFAIDVMLPALHAIGSEMRPDNANAGQAVIAAFLLGVGGAQLVFGPLSDGYGRKPMFIVGLLLFLLGSVLTAFSENFTALLAARLLQGIGAGGQRVVIFSIVRDRHVGVELARVLSLVMTVLLLEPLLAPLFGQAILLFGSWRWIAAMIVTVGAGLLLWAIPRLKESLPASERRAVSLGALANAYREVLTNRGAIIAMLILALTTGSHLGFLTSSQSIFQQTFSAGLRYTLLLALVSTATSLAALANVKLVRRHGSPALVRWCLQSMVLINLLALAGSMAGTPSLWLFLLVQSCNMFAFGLLLPNLTALAMNPFGQIAGTASSLFGFLAATVGALLAFTIGQFFDGSVRPVLAGYVVLTATSLVLTAWTPRTLPR